MTTAGTLTYTFKADVSDLKAKTAEMSASLKAAGASARASAEQVQAGMQASLKAMNDNTAGIKLNGNSWMILGGAIRHGIDGLISGQSAMRVMTVEGIKASAAVEGLSTGTVVAAASLVAAAGIAIATIRAWGQEYEKLGIAAKVATGSSVGDIAKMQQIANHTPGQDQVDIAKSMTDFSLKLREAQVAGGKLADTMQRLGIPIKDASGKARDMKSIFDDVAKAIADGNNEADKMNLAEKLGLGKENIPWLENYADKLRQGETVLSETEKDLIALKEQAAEFDRAWAQGWQDWSDNAKASIASVIKDIQGLNDYIKQTLNEKSSGDLLLGDGGGHQKIVNGKLVDVTENPFPSTIGLADTPVPKPRPDYMPQNRDLSSVYDPQKAKQQRETPGFSMVSSYDKQVQALKAQVAAFNESYAAQMRDVELAKYDTEVSDKLAEMRKNGVTITKQMTDSIAAQREKLIGLTQDYAKFEMQKTQLEGIRESWKQLGDGVADAIDGIAIKGQKLQDVMRNLSQTLASSALKGFLTGEGPFGKMFGFANPTGGLGGVLGMMFNQMPAKATGGRVSAGQLYRVNENGYEYFRPDRDGTVLSHDQTEMMGRGGGGGDTHIYNVDARGADAAAVARLERMMTGFQNNLPKNVMGIVNIAQMRRITP